MNIQITPLTAEQVATMPKFNNIDALQNGLGESFWEKIENIGNKVVTYVDTAADAVNKIKEGYEGSKATQSQQTTTTTYKNPITAKSNVGTILFATVLIGGSFLAYKAAKKKRK